MLLTDVPHVWSVINCFVRTQLLIRRPRLHLPFNAVVTTLSFAFALPVAIALFPQTSSVSNSTHYAQFCLIYAP